MTAHNDHVQHKQAQHGRRTWRFGSILMLALLAALVTAVRPHRAAQAATTITGLHVQGNQILNSNNQPIRLLGVDRSGTEYACIQGWGIFDGPSDATSVQAIASWHVNAVRIPLNEDCWLGINGAPAAYSGTNYQQAIENYVSLLNQNGMVAIVELHWNAPGTAQATGQEPMPDQDHAPAFWQSVATAFKGNSSVLFDLYNEPYPDSNQDTTAAWTCWKNGGTCSGVSFPVAGMQELVTTIRNTGATNIIMAGGVQYANSLSQWLQYEPSDPQNNLAASWHSYAGQVCAPSSCWTQYIAPVIAKVPLVTGEIGESDCGDSYINSLMSWLDSQGASYLAWAWDTYDCSSFPSLISNYNGTPTAYGQGYQAHLAALASSSATSTATPTNTPTSTPLPTTTAAAADFGLSVSPASQSVPSAGGTTTYTVTITPSNGFQGQVTLSASGQPASSTATFSPNPATSSSTLTVSVPARTARGTYTITVRGTSGTLAHTATATLTVTKH